MSATIVEAPPQWLQKRYADAYRIASGIISLAQFVKFVGVALGIIAEIGPGAGCVY